MNSSTPSNTLRLSTLQALTLANLACSIPSLILSVIDQSLVPWLTFVILVQIHAFFLGMPALWLLTSRGLASKLTSTIAGTIIGALPIAFFLSKGSGPGVHYGQSVAIGALSGSVVGLVSYLFVARSNSKIETRHRMEIGNNKEAQERQKPEIRQTSAKSPFFIRKPIIGFFNLAGVEGMELARRDLAEIGAVFSVISKIESEKFPKCNVLFLYCSLEPSGRVSEKPYSLRDVIRATGAHIAVVASDIPPGVVTSREFSSFIQSKNDWPANIVITLNRNGEAFGKFFRNLFSEMHAGTTMPSAWVKLAPQGPLANTDTPGTMALLEAGHIAFAAS